jgi:uncharacterized protein YdiU (UPF0061 family)
MQKTMEKKLADFEFSNRLLKECSFLWTKVIPEPLINPSFLHVNSELMNRMGVDETIKSSPSFLRFCNGDLEFDGIMYASTVYSGHQFGHYVPRLGDGRAMMIGELKTAEGPLEWQLKGSGLTPFSRMGDGKAVVRSSIREYLASAHMHALGIPTTEALSIIKGDDDVIRETVEKGSIVIRVAESFLRFGHFQYFSSDKEKLQTLLEFTIKSYFSEYAEHPNRYVLFFQDVVKRTAKLFAAWQSVGFCHGVLNTDNTSILGLTIDYGPYGFIEKLDLDHVCNHSDYEGRYSFGNQPAIGLWNLERLGEALNLFIPQEDLKRTLQTYPQLFQLEYLRLLRKKCGLVTMQNDDENLMRSLLNMLVEANLDYTRFFRSLCSFKSGESALIHCPPSDKLTQWLGAYSNRLQKETQLESDRHVSMLQTNPKFILRNYLAQMAIENHEMVEPLFKVLTNPFDEWELHEEWANVTPQAYCNLSVSCSS